MFGQNNSRDSPEHIFLSRFQTLSKLLLEDNYANRRNLNDSNHNFNEIFSYVKGILRHTMNLCQKLQQRNRQLEQQLTILDKNNPTLLKKIDRELHFGLSGQKLTNFTPLVPRKADSFGKRCYRSDTNSQMEQMKACPPEIAKAENIRIEQFVLVHLSKLLEQDRLKKQYVPKEMLVNLYIRWSEVRGHKVLIRRADIKTQLTIELKKIFQRMGHSEKNYRGFTFKKTLMTPPQAKQQEQSAFNEWLFQGTAADNEIDQEIFSHLQLSDLDLQSDYNFEAVQQPLN